MKRINTMPSVSPSRLWQILAGILLILGGWIGWNLYADYVATDLQERAALTKQTHVVDENLEHQLIATHHALNAIRSELPKLLAQKDGLTLLKQRLQIMRDAMPTTRAITVFDAQGTLIARSPDQFAGQNFSKRDYFQIARQGGNAATLYVAPPFLAATKEYVLNMSKVVLNAHGDFDGIVLVSLGPEYFSTLLRSVLYAPDMHSELIHANGKMVFQAPEQNKTQATDLGTKPDAFFTQHMASGQPGSVFEGTQTSTGEDRLMVFRTIQPAAVSMDRPLVFAVSRDISALFAPWRTDILVQGSLYLLLVFVSTLGMSSWQRRRREYERLVAEQEAQRQQVAEVLYKQAEALTLSNAELTRLGEAMAHHFQEPARRLVSFTQRLLAKSDLAKDEDSRLSLNFINAESKRLSLLVGEAQRYLALDHGNINSGKGADSGVVLRQCIATAGTAITDANADIVLHDPLPPVQLNAKPLRELFTILLDNALRYRHAQRRLRIEVSASTQRERAVFRFSDNGSGIAPEYRSQALQLFTRLVPSSIPGTGMGLALANKIVHMVAGHLHIEDGLDGGACIVFDLPLEMKV